MTESVFTGKVITGRFGSVGRSSTACLSIYSCLWPAACRVRTVQSVVAKAMGTMSCVPVWVGKELGGEGLLLGEEETHSWFEEEQMK